MMKRVACLMLLALLPAAFQASLHAAEPHFTVDDMSRLAEITEPAISPNGSQIVYTVTKANLKEDKLQSDLWRVRYDGGAPAQLTHTPLDSEWEPQWSSDDRWIVFLSDRSCPAETKGSETQVWMMPADGGEARCVTHFPGGVSDFVLSPNGTRLAVIARDPEFPPGTKAPKVPPPFVTTRFQFKDDTVGWLGSRHKHLYLVDVASGKSALLTAGDHDEALPSWSPNGKRIAYVTRRGPNRDRDYDFQIYWIEARAGAIEHPLTTTAGAKSIPYWGTRPAWSPNGSRIAYLYLQGADNKYFDFAPSELAIIDTNSGKVTHPAPIDRFVYGLQWSRDARSLYALVEGPEVQRLSRIDVATGKFTPLTHGDRKDMAFSLARNGSLVVLGGDDTHASRLAAVEHGRLRTLADPNSWLQTMGLAKTRTLHFRSTDGTTQLDALLVEPADYVPGKRYPTIVSVHGGPVWQFFHVFRPYWQIFAAHGYVVLAVNPRGSSGRGFEFSTAIFADWGNKDRQDVLAGVEHAVRLGIADPDHLGIEGWSYGGILTDQIIAHDTRFKAAISGAGSGNMYGMYGADEYAIDYEIELGTPWDHRSVWDRVSYPFLHANQIVTPTLFQCDGIDFNVPCIGSEQMYQSLRSLNVPTELVVYPDQHHELTIPSYIRDRIQRDVKWFDRFLKPGGGGQQP